MSNRKLTKFPVIAADGTEYRVSIKERVDEDGDPWAVAVLYARSRWRRFTAVARGEYLDGHSVYDSEYPDYIRIARRIVAYYHDTKLPRIKRKSAAIDAFQAWDGRL